MVRQVAQRETRAARRWTQEKAMETRVLLLGVAPAFGAGQVAQGKE